MRCKVLQGLFNDPAVALAGFLPAKSVTGLLRSRRHPEGGMGSLLGVLVDFRVFEIQRSTPDFGIQRSSGIWLDMPGSRMPAVRREFIGQMRPSGSNLGECG